MPDIFEIMGQINRDHLGVSGQIVPAYGDPADITLWIDKEQVNQPDGFNSVVPETVTTIEVSISECGKTPHKGDQFIVDDICYNAINIIENDGMFIKFEVKIDA